MKSFKSFLAEQDVSEAKKDKIYDEEELKQFITYHFNKIFNERISEKDIAKYEGIIGHYTIKVDSIFGGFDVYNIDYRGKFEVTYRPSEKIVLRVNNIDPNISELKKVKKNLVAFEKALNSSDISNLDL